MTLYERFCMTSIMCLLVSLVIATLTLWFIPTLISLAMCVLAYVIGLFIPMLASAEPMHASPMEHQATPIVGRCRNFNGWYQFRAELESSSQPAA